MRRMSAEGPERAALRLDQERQADSTDVSALQVHDFAAHEPREDGFGHQARAQCHRQAIVSSHDVVAELRRHQDQGDEERDQVARVDVARSL